MKLGTPNIIDGNGVARIGTNGPLRPRPLHGPARSDGGRLTGIDLIMMIINGGTEI